MATHTHKYITHTRNTHNTHTHTEGGTHTGRGQRWRGTGEDKRCHSDRCWSNTESPREQAGSQAHTGSRCLLWCLLRCLLRRLLQCLLHPTLSTKSSSVITVAAFPGKR